MDSPEAEKLLRPPRHLEWFVKEEYIQHRGNHFKFLDPVEGTPLEYGQLPPSVAKDPVCRVGIETLRALSAERPIDLYFNYHRGRQDFEHLIDAAGQELADAALVGLEWNYQGALPTTSQTIQWEPFEGGGLAEYIQATREYLPSTTVPIDIDTPIHEEDRLRHRLKELLEFATETPTSDEKSSADYEKLHLGWIAYQNIRGFAMPATLGYMAHLQLQEGKLQPDKPVALIIGSGHSVAVPNKLAQLGIETRSHIVKPLEDTMHNRVYTLGMNEAIMPFKQLKDLANWELTSRAP